MNLKKLKNLKSLKAMLKVAKKNPLDQMKAVRRILLDQMKVRIVKAVKVSQMIIKMKVNLKVQDKRIQYTRKVKALMQVYLCKW
jgi:hypothetical protein